MDRQPQHLPEADNSTAVSAGRIHVEQLNHDQSRCTGCGPVEEVSAPIEPPVILAMSLREALILDRLLNLAMEESAVALQYRLHCKLSQVAFPPPPNTNQHEPTTHKEFSDGTS